MATSTSLISKNNTREETQKYLYTAMVSHRGVPVSFAMREDGKIFYSVLDLSNTPQSGASFEDRDNDKNYWSYVQFQDPAPSMLYFPTEIMQVGYAVVPNVQMDKFDSSNAKIIASFDSQKKPLDAAGKILTEQAIKEKTNVFWSSTARLGAKAPFQALSDGKYIYIFRQSIAANDANNTRPAIVNNTLLVDRFILSGSVLKLTREIRYQRSGHKTEPESRKDTLSPVDMEGRPFYEPTKELAFADNLINGNFSVLLIPGKDSEEQRWQIFTANPDTNKINSFNIKFDYSIVFDTSDAQEIIDEFKDKYEITDDLGSFVQQLIRQSPEKKDDEIATALLEEFGSDQTIPHDALSEIVYTIRTGVSKDDFTLNSTSEWPLIEYNDPVKKDFIKEDFLDKSTKLLKSEYQFQASKNDTLRPLLSPYTPKNGLSSCYYYQQEDLLDGKPMKSKACVMLAFGLEDKQKGKYIGILNFAVAGTGRISQLTMDAVEMPDINVQVLDQNPYKDLASLKSAAAQKMKLIDIDPNGLSTSGGVLKFAYTTVEVAKSQGYSDAVVATAPYLFDDSLGRVNLYFKGRSDNFFVLYFNPTGSKSIEIKYHTPLKVAPPLTLKPRLDRDMKITVEASSVLSGVNTCALAMKSEAMDVETWKNLPQKLGQISGILNGNGELPLGTLEPIGDSTDDPMAAYLKSGNGTLKIRTTTDNNLMFNAQHFFGEKLTAWNTHTMTLGAMSLFLMGNPKIQVAGKSFSLFVTRNPEISPDLFYKEFLAGILTDDKDINKLWELLGTKNIIKKDQPDRAYLQTDVLTGTVDTLNALLDDKAIDDLSLELLAESNKADKKNRLTGLKMALVNLILDVAKVRIVTLGVVDDTKTVERLGAGLPVTVLYDYAANFICAPDKLKGVSAPKWEYQRSYLFDAAVNNSDQVSEETKITRTYNYTFDVNNSIGEWMQWETGLAIEMKPASAAIYTLDQNKLMALQPSEKGLSVEAWAKPAESMTGKGTLVYYKYENNHYELGIEKDSNDHPNRFKCVALLTGQKYVSKNSFDILNGKREQQWIHLAFSHKKYWGYQLGSTDKINCGDDNSLNLNGEFSIEIFVKIDAPGTLLEKKDEYALSVNASKEIVFNWNGKNCLSPQPISLPNFGQFCKITLIRSTQKPQTEASKTEYPLTGHDPNAPKGSTSSDKWYEGKSSDQMIKGMAEKQDRMEKQMDLSQMNMLGGPAGLTSGDFKPKYYHTLIIAFADNTPKEWTSPLPEEIRPIEKFGPFLFGGGGFSGAIAGARIWSRALATADAKLLTPPENKTGLISNWRMAEGTDKYLYDDISENHGVAEGGAWTDSPQPNLPGQFQFYVDGAPEPSESPVSFPVPEDNQFSIGAVRAKSQDSFSDRFNGTLEEIRIWNVPRTNEQITDNAFGRLKGEWELLLANYTFDLPISKTGNKVQDSSINSIHLDIAPPNQLEEVLSTAPVATEIPQVRSALAGVTTEYNGTLRSVPGVVEYGDVQKNDDGTLNGVLKRCYSFIDDNQTWNRMTGYKVGNLVSHWYGQTQFAPQVMGYLEGSAPVPVENLLGSTSSPNNFAVFAELGDNSVKFRQAEEIAYNYNTSKEAGWNVGVTSELDSGFGIETLVAPMGFGISFEASAQAATASNWETSGNRAQSFDRGTSVNNQMEFSAALAGYVVSKDDKPTELILANTGFALVKSKTADLYLLRLAHNNALVSIFWQPNPDIPEDVNIIPFPINPLYIKQGTLDGKFGDKTDVHYPQAQGAYGQYSYFKPREAYKLKQRIEREKLELKAFFEDSFDVAQTNAHFQAAAATTGVAQLAAAYPLVGPMIVSAANQIAGQIATQVGYNNTKLKDDLSKMGSQRNLVNTYVWTIEGGFFAESTEVAETQQETFSNETGLSLGGELGALIKAEGGLEVEQRTMFSSGSSFTLTKSKTKSSANSFGLDVCVALPVSPRYQYGGKDRRSLVGGLLPTGAVDAYRFMSFYLEPKGENFEDLFHKVIDPIWLEESADPYAIALRQARGDLNRAKPCWRVMHRVTYVSRVLPKFQPEAPPSLEKAMQMTGIESNYMLIKRFEPYLTNVVKNKGSFFNEIETIIKTQMPEFIPYQKQIKNYLALYFHLDQA